MPRKSRHPIQKCLSMSPEAAEFVENAAEERGVPESQILREAVELYMEAMTRDDDAQATLTEIE
jgi:predicted DNA-binding protein